MRRFRFLDAPIAEYRRGGVKRELTTCCTAAAFGGVLLAGSRGGAGRGRGRRRWRG